MGNLQKINGAKKPSLMLTGKIPPQARELEEVILGAIMIDNRCLSEVLNLIFKDI